jgi:hypothetical protein
VTEERVDPEEIEARRWKLAWYYGELILVEEVSEEEIERAREAFRGIRLSCLREASK